MATTWIVAADDSRARVLQVTDRERHLTEIEDLVNPAGRAQDRELQTDAEPRFNGTPGGPPSDPERQGAVERSVRLFAREVGRYLDKARIAQRYDALVLAAPPKFLGALSVILPACGASLESAMAGGLPWCHAGGGFGLSWA